jgi:ABC-2 type transport system permease protein
MKRIFVIARAEFMAMVRSKAFLISLAVLPLFSVGGGLLQEKLGGHDARPKKFAVIETSGAYYAGLQQRVEARNAMLAGSELAPFVIERATPSGSLDELRLQLSERVRKEELFAFIELPDDLVAAPWRYYAENRASSELREFIGGALTAQVRARDYADAHMTPELIARLQKPVTADRLGLFTRRADGTISAAKADPIKDEIVPMVLPFLLFFFIVISTPQMMNAVLIEKMSRISEVLLGSVTTFQLMLGKLLGSVAVSVLLGAAYLSCLLLLAQKMGYGGMVTPGMIALFLVFLALAMFLYGSFSLAVGAACTDLKEAQNLMLPVMLPLMLPMMMMGAVVESPTSALSVGVSLFPLATPMLMLLRLGLHPAPPIWQVALSIVGTLLTTIVCVFAAGRIFRVGLLSQGKSASFADLLRWMLAR